VLVATGHIVRADDPAEEDRDAGDYLITFTGVDTNTHTVAWAHPVPARYDSAYDYLRPHLVPRADLWFTLDAVLRPDGVLISAFSKYDQNFATLLVDDAGVRWQTDMPALGPTIGRYTLSTADHGHSPFGNLVVLDLSTGQVRERLDPSLRAAYRYLDPQGDESRSVIRFDGGAAPDSYLRFSSQDGTMEPFVPGKDDVRYDRDCEAEPGQVVILCNNTPGRGFAGVDRTSGKVLWTLGSSTMDTLYGTAHYHGYLYGKYGAVYSLETGDVVNSSTGLSHIGGADAYEDFERGLTVSRMRPIIVNEYGAVGRIGPERHVWVPASG